MSAIAVLCTLLYTLSHPPRCFTRQDPTMVQSQIPCRPCTQVLPTLETHWIRPSEYQGAPNQRYSAPHHNNAQTHWYGALLLCRSPGSGKTKVPTSPPPLMVTFSYSFLLVRRMRFTFIRQRTLLPLLWWVKSAGAWVWRRRLCLVFTNSGGSADGINNSSRKSSSMIVAWMIAISRNVKQCCSSMYGVLRGFWLIKQGSLNAHYPFF